MALHLSLVTVGTLGFGDITPAYPALRLLIPLQVLIGFILFTAAISWVLQIYPAPSRRRATARRLTLMATTGIEQILGAGETSVAVQWLDSVTDALIAIELDLVQYGETYFFRDADADLSLAAALSYLPRLLAAGTESGAIEVRPGRGDARRTDAPPHRAVGRRLPAHRRNRRADLRTLRRRSPSPAAACLVAGRAATDRKTNRSSVLILGHGGYARRYRILR